MPLGLTHFQKKTPAVINNVCSTREEQKPRRLTEQSTAALSFVLFFFICLLLLDSTATSHTHRHSCGSGPARRKDVARHQKLDTFLKPDGFGGMKKKKTRLRIDPLCRAGWSFLPGLHRWASDCSWKCIRTDAIAGRECYVHTVSSGI